MERQETQYTGTQSASAHSRIRSLVLATQSDAMLSGHSNTDQARRDVLYLCGCALVGAGLFPFLHARFYRWSNGLGDNDDARADGMSELAADMLHTPSLSALTSTAFDLVTCAIAAACALLGVGVMFLSCLELPSCSMRACLKTFAVPLAVLAAASAVLVLSFYCGETNVMWRASAARSFGFESNQTNDVIKTRATTVSSHSTLSYEASRGAAVIAAVLSRSAQLLTLLSCLALSALAVIARWYTDPALDACPHQ